MTVMCVKGVMEQNPARAPLPMTFREEGYLHVYFCHATIHEMWRDRH